MPADINILIVDDEEVIRSLFVDILEDVGYRVTAVSNGPQAIERIKKERFNIVFIDCHMPEMSGLETLKAIKEIDPKIKTVMTDSYPDKQLEESLKEGAYTCIHKPFDIQEVKRIIREIIKKRGYEEGDRC